VGNKLDENHENNIAHKFPPLVVKGKDIRSIRKRKRISQSSEDNILEAMKEVANMFGSHLKHALDNLSKADIGAIASENMSRLNKELHKVFGQTLKATKLIACQHQRIDVFLSMPYNKKEELVKEFINGNFCVVDESWII
jgi:hypothetical protein